MPTNIVKPLQWWDYNRDHPIAEGLVFYTALWAKMGPTAFDVVNGNHGTLTNGPTWVPEGLNFDGGASDQKVVISPAPALDRCIDTNALTMYVRMRLTGDGTEDWIMGKWGGNDWVMGNQASSGTLKCFFRDVGAWRDSGVSYDSTKMTNFIVTWDGTNIRMYVDDIEGTSFTEAITLADKGDPWTIGASVSDYAPKGQVEQAGVWYRALAAAETVELSGNPNLLSEPPSTKTYFYYTAPAPTGAAVGILQRGNMPGILARAG